MENVPRSSFSQEMNIAQNIYDNPDFFTGYSQLPRQVQGLDSAPEWPVIRALLPELESKRVADLGCGFGWASRWFRENGAASVLGLDLSRNMIDRARADTDDAAIDYRIAGLDTLGLTEAAFDLVYSALTFHYVQDFGRLIRMIHAALAPGGDLVFTIEHPIFMAAAKRRGGHVTASTSPTKMDSLKALGADVVMDRNDAFPKEAFDVVLDLVGGPRWPELLDALVPRGRYVTSGAIAGPIVELDLRTLYLKDLTLIGSTRQDPRVFTDLVSYIEAGEIHPVVAETYPLRELRTAQEAFLEKSHMGKIGIVIAG